MRRSNQTHVSAGYTWEPENYEGNIPASYDFSILATCYPGSRGDRDEPPHNGGIEITAVHLLVVHTEGRVYPAGGEPRRAELEAEFAQWLMHPAQVFVLKRLEEELCAEAHEQELAAKEEAGERRAEARREDLETADNERDD